MMKPILPIAALFAATAQAPVPRPDPAQQALSQELIDAIGRSVQWHAAAIKAEQELAPLKAAAAAKPAPAPLSETKP